MIVVRKLFSKQHEDAENVGQLYEKILTPDCKRQIIQSTVQNKELDAEWEQRIAKHHQFPGTQKRHKKCFIIHVLNRIITCWFVVHLHYPTDQSNFLQVCADACTQYDTAHKTFGCSHFVPLTAGFIWM